MARITVLRLALRVLIFFHEDAINPSKTLPEQTRKGPYAIDQEPQLADCVRPFREITLLCCMNTVPGFIYGLVTIKGDLLLDRIGTHPLENFFGLLRRILHDCDRFDEFLHAVTRTIIVDDAFEELRHHRNICGLTNIGGVVCKFDDTDAGQAAFDLDSAYDEIQAFVQLLLHGSSQAIDDSPGMTWLRVFDEG
jgi:hypothetical protein